MLGEVRPRCPALREAHRARGRLGRRCSPTRERVSEDELARARSARCSSTTRSTSSTRRARPASQGRDALAPQHPQQRLLHRRDAAATPRQDRVCIPVPFYHCFGMVLGNLGLHVARRLHGRPGARASMPLAVLEAVAGRALHVALRRADDVHRRARPPALRRVRPLVPAHRHHGRLALPGRGDEAGAGRGCTCPR